MTSLRHHRADVRMSQADVAEHSRLVAWFCELLPLCAFRPADG